MLRGSERMRNPRRRNEGRSEVYSDGDRDDRVLVHLLRGQQDRREHDRLGAADRISPAFGSPRLPDDPAGGGRELLPPLPSGKGSPDPPADRCVRLPAGSVRQSRLCRRLPEHRHGASEDRRPDGKSRDGHSLQKEALYLRLARHGHHAGWRPAGAGRGLRRDGAACDGSLFPALGGLCQRQCLYHQDGAGEVQRGRGHDLLLQQRGGADPVRDQRRAARGFPPAGESGERVLVASCAGRPGPDRNLLLLLPEPQALRGLAGQALSSADAGAELLHRGLLPE